MELSVYMCVCIYVRVCAHALAERTCLCTSSHSCYVWDDAWHHACLSPPPPVSRIFRFIPHKCPFPVQTRTPAPSVTRCVASSEPLWRTVGCSNCAVHASFRVGAPGRGRRRHVASLQPFQRIALYAIRDAVVSMWWAEGNAVKSALGTWVSNSDGVMYLAEEPGKGWGSPRLWSPF